jgi:hypothetical protein
MATRKEKLERCGWTIHAELGDRAFVVETSQGDYQVLYFYTDCRGEIPMVEGYFTSSFGFKARNELINDPEKFVGNFYIHTAGVEPDWVTKEEYL